MPERPDFQHVSIDRWRLDDEEDEDEESVKPVMGAVRSGVETVVSATFIFDVNRNSPDRNLPLALRLVTSPSACLDRLIE